MTRHDDRRRPRPHQPRNVRADDRLAKDRAIEDVADRAVRRLPHLLEAKLLHTRFIRRNRRALHADAVLLDGVRGIDRDLVVGRVARLDAQVEVLEVDIQIGRDELVLDERPDHARHLVAIELDERRLYLDLGHLRYPMLLAGGIAGTISRCIRWSESAASRRAPFAVAPALRTIPRQSRTSARTHWRFR